eukprot:gene37910-46779_t
MEFLESCDIEEEEEEERRSKTGRARTTTEPYDPHFPPVDRRVRRENQTGMERRD